MQAHSVKHCHLRGLLAALVSAAAVTGCAEPESGTAIVESAASAVPSSARMTHTAKLILPESELNLGAVTITEEGHIGRFQVLNAGDGPLEILSLGKSCLCAVPDITNTLIAPGESAELTVTVHPEEAGPGSAHVTIESSDAYQPFRSVSLVWTASAPLEVEPPQIRLGRIDAGDQGVFEAKLTQRVPECVAVRAQASSPGVLSASILPHVDGSLLRIVVDAGAERGPHEESVSLELEGCWRNSITVPVSWTTGGLVESKPLRLFLGAGRAGEQLAQALVLYTPDGTALAVGAIEWESPIAGAKVLPSNSSVSSAEFVVEWSVPEETGVHTGELSATIMSPETTPVMIPVTGIVLAKPEGPNEEAQ